MRSSAALFLAWLSSTAAFADSESLNYKHVVEGHTFPPLYYIDRAFSDTTVQLSLGVAKRDLPFNGTDLELGGFSPKLDLQVNVWKDLAISVGLLGTLIAGINSTSAIQYGASTSYTFSAGANYELWRDGPNVLSGNFTVLRPHTLAVSPINASVAGIFGLNEGANSSFVTSGVSTQYRPTVRYARSFGPVFGVQSEIGASANDSGTDEGPRFLFGVGGDVDFGKLTPVAVSLAVSYARNQIVSLPGNNSDVLDIGILDSTNNSFNAGGDLIFIWTGGSTTTAGAIRIRTYFD
jgi:hypothetical protein